MQILYNLIFITIIYEAFNIYLLLCSENKFKKIMRINKKNIYENKIDIFLSFIPLYILTAYIINKYFN
jgi:hypothetical protein